MAEIRGSAGGLRRKMNTRSKLLSPLDYFLWQNSPYILNDPGRCKVKFLVLRNQVHNFDLIKNIVVVSC